MFVLPHHRLATISACIALISSSFALTANGDDADQPVQKVYDIRDLLVQVQDFTDAPHLGIETPEAAESAAKHVLTRNELIEQQLEWIRSGLGSDAAQVALTGEDGKIKVTANPQAQQQIERMLAKARSVRATQVDVEIHELVLNGTDDLPRNLRSKLHEAFAPGGKPIALADEDVQDLLKAAQAGSGSTVITAPRVTVFDGQRAYVLVSQQKAYRAGVGVSEVNGRRISEPLISTVSTGVVVKVRPAVDEDGAHVALDLQFEEAKLLDMRKEPAREPGQSFSVEVPVIERVQVDRTLSASGGRTLLVAIPQANRNAAPNGRSRVLLVKTTVVKPELK
jgi:hypothetical protein